MIELNVQCQPYLRTISSELRDMLRVARETWLTSFQGEERLLSSWLDKTLQSVCR